MHRCRWTDKELNIIKEHGSTMLTKELVNLLPNRTSQSIRAMLFKLGIYMTVDTKQRMNNTRVSNRLLFGVGINDLASDPVYVTNIKDSSRQIIWKCPYYNKWVKMIGRCYTDERPSYKDCTVSDEWHYFSNFKRWMESCAWEGKELDKDILIPGNKVYGKDACLFVSRELNSLFMTNDSRRGEYPIGVTRATTVSDRYQSRIKKHGKMHNLGNFSTPEEAASVYTEHRREYIIEVANGLTLDDTSDVDRTRAALLQRMDSIKILDE